MTLPNWKSLTSSERIDIVRPLWMDSGLAASAIADHFTGATRSAVIGAVHRAKLPKRGPDTTAMRSTKQRQAGLVYGKPEKPKPAPKPVEPPKTPVERVSADLPLYGVAPISILELPNRPYGVCRWPVEGGYCGISCGDKVYCPTHHGMAYRETTPITKPPKEARL